jgi:cytochrome c oxidase subunit 2
VRRSFLALSAAFLLALVSASAAAAETGLAPVTPRSSNAESIRDTYWLILAITGGIFVLVEAALLVFIFRFRSRGRARTLEGAQIHGATRLEMTATIVPVLILAAIASFVFVKLPSIKDVPPATAGSNALNVRVEAHQFYWQFVYPDGAVSVRRLAVPVNRVVTLDLVSSDVAHSWWVPALGGKTDAIPGRTNHTWFRANRIGSYEIRCAEFCGLEHAHMTGFVDVVTEAEYRRFLAAHRPSATVLGKEIADGVCATCHGLAGEGDYGPPIVGSALLADRNGLERLLRDGGVRMPAVGKTWSPAVMNAALDYLEQRYGGGAGGGQG